MGQRLSTSAAPVLPRNASAGKSVAASAAQSKKKKRAFGKRASVKDSDGAPQLVAHLGSLRRRSSIVSESNRTELLHAAISELTSDMEVLRKARPGKFGVALSQLLEERQAPMLLLDAEALKGRGRLPCYDEVEASLIPFGEVDEQKDTVCFISHRWFKPGVPDGLRGEKVAIVCDILAKTVAPKAAGGRVLLWWDFFSIAQNEAEIHVANKGAQILAIPFYLAASTCLIALRGGDEDSYNAAVLESADGGQSHPGRYDNRVWTMLELFGFTSDFSMGCHARRFGGEAGSARRCLVDCRLGFSGEALVATSIECEGRLESVRAELHDTPGWTLPPGANLTDLKDLAFIEPMVIALAVPPDRADGADGADSAEAAPSWQPDGGLVGCRASSLARLLHTATSFGFEHAVSSFLSLLRDSERLDAEIDAEDEAGHTAISRAVMADKPAIVRQLLGCGADYTRRHRTLGTTPIQTAVALRRAEIVRTLLDAYRAAAAPLPTDALGRTLLHVAACTMPLYRDGAAEGTVDESKLGQLRQLLLMGVDPTARDRSGRTASDLMHARGEAATLAAFEALLPREQAASCLPRTSLTHALELPPAPQAAVLRVGAFTPHKEAHGATYWFDRFAPRAKVAGKAAPGPKILLLGGYVSSPHTQLMEHLVGQFGATVWQLRLVPSLAEGHRQPSGVWSSGVCASHVEQFIDAELGGRADVAIGWCMPGEWLVRVAVAAPAKVGAVALCSTPATPMDKAEMVGMMNGLHSALTHCTPEQIGMGLMQQECPALVRENPGLAGRYASEMGPLWLDLARENGMYAPGGYFADWVQQTNYWRHWSAMERPLLLMAGTDDTAFLVGIQHLASLVPTARLEWIEGVAHMPMCEAPGWWREQLLDFVAQQGFERLQVVDL